MSSQRKRQDSQWLQEVLTGLLEHARSRDPPDHQACAKYAELLFKMLPKAEAAPGDESWLEEARRSAMGEAQR
jgi:hypothetical protein